MRFKDNVQVNTGTSLPFVKLKNGERVVGVFKGEIKEFYRVWGEQGEVPQGTKGASFRFRINFITKEGASYVAKVFEQGATVYNALKDLNESYPLEETVVEIKRSGSTKDDTYYSVLPLPPKQQPGPQGWAVINRTELVDLGTKAKPKQEPPFDDADNWPSEPPHEDNHELPF